MFENLKFYCFNFFESGWGSNSEFNLSSNFDKKRKIGALAAIFKQKRWETKTPASTGILREKGAQDEFQSIWASTESEFTENGSVEGTYSRPDLINK